jgi:hypothetical protein
MRKKKSKLNSQPDRRFGFRQGIVRNRWEWRKTVLKAKVHSRLYSLWGRSRRKANHTIEQFVIRCKCSPKV